MKSSAENTLNKENYLPVEQLETKYVTVIELPYGATSKSSEYITYNRIDFLQKRFLNPKQGGVKGSNGAFISAVPVDYNITKRVKMKTSKISAY